MIVPPALDKATRSLPELLRRRELRPVFQPIFAMADGSVFAYEALIRGPAGSALESPLALFAEARRLNLEADLELACCRLQMRDFARQQLPGKLFLNVSSRSLLHAGDRLRRMLRFVLEHGMSPTRLVAELTEQESVVSHAAFVDAVKALRAIGLGLALDDYGEGRSSLRLWVDAQPELVKIDRYFIDGIDAEPRKFEAVRGLVRLARAYGTELVAEGVQTEAELTVVRDLGIEYAQGHLLGRPQSQPARDMGAPARAVLGKRQIAVFPEAQRHTLRQRVAGQCAQPAPCVTPGTSNDELSSLFARHPELHALPVVDRGRPLGLVNRRAFMDRYAQPFQRELYGRKPCTAFMDSRSLLVDKSTPLQALAESLTGQDQNRLADGFIVTDAGQYLGIGTGEALVRAVTELRVEAARYANPLTFLPGNIPISEHVGRLLAGAAPFVAAYADLNQFKPYNDHYGYWRGDEMIKLAARVLSECCDPVGDFLGHVGGDDFVLLMQSPDWERRCLDAIRHFNAEAHSLFDEEDRQRGGIRGEDRHGQASFFPMTTISIGAAVIDACWRGTAENIAGLASAAKCDAKRRRRPLCVIVPGGARPIDP